jgi:hypothetical protein
MTMINQIRRIKIKITTKLNIPTGKVSNIEKDVTIPTYSMVMTMKDFMFMIEC